MASGATNREIAGSLHLSPHTVKEHTSSLFRKLDVRNRTEAVQRAQRVGLLGLTGRPPERGRPPGCRVTGAQVDRLVGR